ncbi:MAG: hypothetical protein PUB35_00690 [Campylobacteraceae bacterium]|nr:hypothetical protein [Campylobacteraceae bacterium]
MGFAVAAVKTRLQDFLAIFSFKAAAQGFKAKKRHPAGAKQPADAKQKKLSQPIKANKKLGNFGILCDEIPGQGG